MHDLILLKNDALGELYTRGAALSFVRVIPEVLRGTGAYLGDVEIQFLSGSRDWLSDAQWAAVKPLLVMGSSTTAQDEIKDLEGELAGAEKTIAELEDRIAQLEAALKAKPDEKSGEISPQSEPVPAADPVKVEQLVELIMSLPGATSDQAEQADDPVTFEQVMEDSGEISPPKTVPDHYKRVIEVKRRTFDSKTTSSKRTMWTCFTDEGLTFNLFDHADPLRDHKPLLEEAGYLSFFQLMPEGGVTLWKQNPIRVAIEPNGKFWNVEQIAPRHPDAIPDEIDESSLTPEQLVACRAAKTLLEEGSLAIFDFETTGLESDCEIVEVSIVSGAGEYIFTEFVKPIHMENLRRPGKNGLSSFDIHGIDEQTLAAAASLSSPYMQQQFEKHLGGKVWAAFNAAFEERLLRQSWTLAGVEAPQPEPVRIVDVQALTDQFIGHKKTSVDEACRVLKLGPTDRHRAAGDAMDTYRILRALADKVPVETQTVFPF